MGALYHLKQKLVDFCNVIQENVSRTDTVPSSKVVYDLKADSDSQISDLNNALTNKQNTKWIGIVNHGTSTTFQVATGSVSQATLVTAQYGDVAFLYIVSYEGTYAIGDGTGSGLTITYASKVITVKNDHASRNYRVSAFGVFA